MAGSHRDVTRYSDILRCDAMKLG